MLLSRRARIRGIHFVGEDDEVTGDRGLPMACGLEVDSNGGTHGAAGIAMPFSVMVSERGTEN